MSRTITLASERRFPKTPAAIFADRDAEHPHLYTLQVDLDGGKQQTALRMGIRTLQLAGNQVLVNGKPIKGRGTTRHETHPLFGRSLWGVAPEGGQWERDIIAFRDLNVNWIRTSHYPPAVSAHARSVLMISADDTFMKMAMIASMTMIAVMMMALVGRRS